MPFCSECGDECRVKEIDEGIGSYEFWGCRGTDHQCFVVSVCCEATAYERKCENEGVVSYFGEVTETCP